jgi:Fe2+ or Zn2+ uptake regulation protein
MNTVESKNTGDTYLDEESFYAIHNALGNSEAKMITLGAIALHEGAPLIKSEIHNDVIARQGPVPAWKLAHGVPFQYCQSTLNPNGLLVQSEREGKKTPKLVPAFEISPFGAKWGMSYTGAVAPWSIEHDDISLFQLFGATNTTGSLRSPEVRHRIWTEIVTSSNDPSYNQIINAIANEEISPMTIYEAIHNMVRIGLMKAISVYDKDFDPRLEIVSPYYAKSSIAFSQLNHLTQLNYHALQNLSESGISKPKLSEIVETAILIDPSIDTANFRSRIMHGLTKKNQSTYGLKALDREGLEQNQKSKLTVESELLLAVQSLLDLMDNARQPKFRDSFITKAKQFLSNPPQVAALMKKAKDNSPYQRGHEEGSLAVSSKILSILSILGETSLMDIQDMLQEQGEYYSILTLRTALNHLVQSTKIVESIHSITSNRKRPIKHYNLAS